MVTAILGIIVGGVITFAAVIGLFLLLLVGSMSHDPLIAGGTWTITILLLLFMIAFVLGL